MPPTATPSEAILFLNPAEVVQHPLLDTLPRLDPESPEVTDFYALVAADGEIYVPVLVDGNQRLIDGRRRLAAARKYNFALKAVVVASDAALRCMLGTLATNGRYTKSACAYLAYPHLRASTGTVAQQEVVSLRLGFSATLYRYAASVHKLFDKRPEMKAELEPKILSGDLDLTNVGKAVEGIDATRGQCRRATNFSRFINYGIRSMQNGFRGWSKIGDDDREKITGSLCDLVRTALPEETRKRVRRALDEADKAAG